MALATQCPHCYTSFRVANDQLKLYAGMVRCGACKQTFNGIEHLIPPGSTPKHAPEPALDLAPIPVAEQPPTSEQEEIAVSAPIEPAQPDLANTSDQDADQDADQHDDLESNLRALLQEIKVRQQDEEDTAEQSSETTMPAEPIAQASAEPPAPDNAAEEALVHLEMLETEEEPPVSPAAKPTSKALTASLDFDLDDNFSPVVTAATTPIKSNKKTLDAASSKQKIYRRRLRTKPSQYRSQRQRHRSKRRPLSRMQTTSKKHLISCAAHKDINVMESGLASHSPSAF
ncbi:MAG: zinc-ribbon domain-containing protein [Burkholderiales bacterium]|nr:zinc-ribbon domain-containing protein [Burkholderiales bacterium]